MESECVGARMRHRRMHHSLLVNFVIKEPLIELETKGNGAHNSSVELMAGLESVSARSNDGHSSRKAYVEEVEHGLLEPRDGAFLRPAIPPSCVPVPANLHGFLAVRCLLAHCSNLRCVCGLGDPLTANLNISTVRARVFPCKLVLLVISVLEWNKHKKIVS